MTGLRRHARSVLGLPLARSGLQSPYPVGPGSPGRMAVGDLNRDGLIDVVVADAAGTVIVLLNQSSF